MSTIVTRAGKGSPLTNNEVDANFTNLNTDKIQVTGTPVVGYTILWNGTAWVPGISGSGDVTGPASSTDNALARFDSTTGKLIQNSTAILSDTGALATANVTSDYFAVNTGAGVTPAVGQRAWDASQGTTALGLLGGNVISRDGQSLIAYVTNAESVTITKGQAVYLFSAVGDRASVKLAYNTGDATSAKTLGLVAEDIAAGQAGFVMCQGVAYKMDTSTYTAGDSLYLGATAGSLTTTKPYAPNHLVYIGTVEKANAGNGQIYVRVQNGYELEELHNVAISSPTTGQSLTYNSGTGLWSNATVAVTLSNDTSTSTNLYPLFAGATSGTASTIYTGDAKLLYKPSTGELKSSAVISGNGISLNADSVTASYTIATGTNGFSVGPLTIASGVTVTIASGQRHIII